VILWHLDITKNKIDGFFLEQVKRIQSIFAFRNKGQKVDALDKSFHDILSQRFVIDNQTSDHRHKGEVQAQ
jgi:hypothetical protein